MCFAMTMMMVFHNITRWIGSPKRLGHVFIHLFSGWPNGNLKYKKFVNGMMYPYAFAIDILNNER